MDDTAQPPPADRPVELLDRGARDEAAACLELLAAAGVDDRKAAVRSLRRAAERDPGTVAPVCRALAPFLADEERSVRLTTAKLFVALAASTPESLLPVVPSLADRLADDDEFYYVRARAAEALGYVARDHPGAVDSPAVVADLRVGLAFDGAEVREKLAKALEGVALGDPGRLRHQVATLADHLDDDPDLVRYHLTTALAAVGTGSPDRLAPAADALARRLDDAVPQVRGRAAEALGLLARADDAAVSLPASRLRALRSAADEPAFVVARADFALGAAGDESVGSVAGIRATTDGATDAVAAPAAEAVCRHCGAELPGAPPICPRCGGPP
jgi:HEAT repeat protein